MEYVDENGKRYKHVVGECGYHCSHCDLDPKTCVGNECSSFCYLIEIVDDIQPLSRRNKMNFSVTKNGLPLSPDLYTWDEKTKTFSTNESHLVLDFSNISNCTFKTGLDCTFKTGSHCVFNTGYSCTFKTGYDCTFKTGSYCVLTTGSDCTFKTGSHCVIVRRDVFEIIQPEPNVEIKLNNSIQGFEVVNRTHDIVIDDKTITLSEESFNNLKAQLIGE